MPVGYSHTCLSLFSVAPAQFHGGCLLWTTSPACLAISALKPLHDCPHSYPLLVIMTVIASLSSWISCCLFGPKQIKPLFLLHLASLVIGMPFTYGRCCFMSPRLDSALDGRVHDEPSTLSGTVSRMSCFLLFLHPDEKMASSFSVLSVTSRYWLWNYNAWLQAPVSRFPQIIPWLCKPLPQKSWNFKLNGTVWLVCWHFCISIDNFCP